MLNFDIKTHMQNVQILFFVSVCLQQSNFITGLIVDADEIEFSRVLMKRRCLDACLLNWILIWLPFGERTRYCG